MSTDVVQPGLRLQAGLVEGMLTVGAMTATSIVVQGQVRLLTDGVSPVTITILAAGYVVERLEIAFDNSDFQPIKFDVEIDRFRPPLFVDLQVFATDLSGAGLELPTSGTASDLSRIKIGSRQDFLRLVQSPTERLKDPNLLFYVSKRGLSLFADDYPSKSAATVVMGYRLLEGLVVPVEDRMAFWTSIEELLPSVAPVPRGLWMRWHTSLRLVAGYLAHREGRQEAASNYFAGVAEFAFELSHWPTALTNVLIGIFLSGWTAYEMADFPRAARLWRRAEGVLRYGASIAQFSNYYAFGEMSNAIKVAQECFVGLAQAENGGRPIDDTRSFPAGYKLDVRHLSGVAYNLGITKA